MDICFEGIGQMAATFAAKEELAPGMAVTLTDSGEVGLGEDGEPLCGVTVGASRNGAVAVQIGGVVKVGCSGTAPEVGWQELACDGKGGAKTADDTALETGGMKVLVLAVDEAEKTVAVKL